MSKEKITVVKLGGNCMDDTTLLHSFLVSFSKIEGKKVLVHGGGKFATVIGNKLGIPVQMIEGRRVTCAETLKIVTMTYAGLINKELVSKLHTLHCNAFGLSGVDGNLIQAKKRNSKPFDYGFVGDPVAVNSTLLVTLIDAGYIPVISPITHNKSGQLLNTNADTVASFIAAALTSKYDVHLLFAFDKKGVLKNPGDDESVISELSKMRSEELKNENQIAGGMFPKLTAGYAALEKNVSRVTIQHLTSLETTAESTTLVL
jgi:acetylglutamate kinase